MTEPFFLFQETLNTFYIHWIDWSRIADELSRMCVLFTLVYLFSKYSPAFSFLIRNSLRRRDWLWLYGLFSCISILGSLLAIKVSVDTENNIWAIANIRSIGTVLAGLLGGPILGTAVGFTSGFVRYLSGGVTASVCFLGTTLAGLIAGLVYLFLWKYKPEERFNRTIAFLTTFIVESLNKVLVLWAVQDLGYGLNLIQAISIPMLLSNCLGVVLCVSILHDYDHMVSSLSSNALGIARRFAEVLKRNTSLMSAAHKLAQIVKSETGATAVALTDKTQLLAFVGIGEEHHHTGDTLGNHLIRNALNHQDTLFIDGHSEVFHCTKAHPCRLHSAFIAPIVLEDTTAGSIILFESKDRFFSRINRDLAENLASLLAEQMVTARYPERIANLEDKYLRTRINPHFFANALATISAITRTDTSKARTLLGKLSALMRERVNPAEGCITLHQELEFLDNYISIEKARFKEHLHISIQVDAGLDNIQIPRFVLQLLVENAIKHGTSKLLSSTIGQIDIHVRTVDTELVQIEVRDNAGLYNENKKRQSQTGRYGMKMAEDLIRSEYHSDRYGISVHCENDCYTRIIVSLPLVC